MWKDLPVAFGMVFGAAFLAAGNNNVPVWQAMLIGAGLMCFYLGIDWLLRAIFPAYRRAREKDTSTNR
jgi:hypothetical protein